MPDRNPATEPDARDQAAEPQPDDGGRSGSPSLGGLSGAVTAALGTAVEAAGEALQVAGSAVEAAGRRWRERPGQRVRRVRRLGRQPLPNLFEAHPEARRATPRDLGVRSISVDEIRGTAVAGPAQRGGDFLPLKPFRSQNWAGRWQRIRRAVDRLTVLPPIDVVRYADGYWVTDGHNRVAAALYAGQVEIDATVTELVPPGGRSTERAGSLAGAMQDSRAVRSAASGGRPVGHTELEERLSVPRDNGDRDLGGEDRST
jgi:hypothetical protein